MPRIIDLNQWIYILVEKSPAREHIVAQHDTESDVRFIPIFMDRDAAQSNAGHFHAAGGCEVQAIIFEDLLRYAAQSRAMIFLLDEKGAILSKITPDGSYV